MQKVNGYNFYQIGTFIHPFTELKHGVKLSEIWFLAYQAKGWLADLANDKLVPLIVSKDAINRLYWSLNEILPNDIDWTKIDFDKVIDVTLIQKILKSTADFETIFGAELNSINTYFVSQKLAYETRVLIESADHLFPENIRKEIPKEAINDIKQAGRCIAFDIPTGAAFHIIRATETVIRQYYGKVVGKPPKAKMRNWGAYIRTLRKCGADQRVTGFLDNIREAYRNPVLHPEIMVESQRVQVFLGVCVSAILQMIEAMQTVPTLPILPPQP